jgi:hypothetical protein
MDDVAASTEGMAMNENQMQSLNRAVHDMTNAVTDIFRLISQTDFRQDVLLTKLTESQAKITAAGTRQFIDTLEETNRILADLRGSVGGRSTDTSEAPEASSNDDKLREFLTRPRSGVASPDDEPRNAG